MNFPSDAQLLSGIPLRHSVRSYKPEPVAEDILDCLRAKIEEINREQGLDFALVAGNGDTFTGFFASYGKFRNVRNYIVVAAARGDAFSVRCGYWGQRLVLAMQVMGLNSCWVGLSYNKSKLDYHKRGAKVRCVICFGYGETEGVSHKVKAMEKVSNVGADSPGWFRKGVGAALLAPTAINQQKFRFTLNDDGSVTATPGHSLAGYTRLDLGIAIANFNLAAGSKHQIYV